MSDTNGSTGTSTSLPPNENGDRESLLEELRWQKFPVLNDGFVCLVDVMGNDRSVCQAARVSYGAGTRRVSDDRKLIRILMRNRHTSPLEMAELKFLVRVPMDCWRQWARHRTASINEYSTRYSEAIDSMQSTAPDEWRLQSGGNKQGSDGHLPAEPPDDRPGAWCGRLLTEYERDFHRSARHIYETRLLAGVAREQARKDLPLSTYTEAYWKIDLHNLLHFLSLRMDSHAQQEIREYATIIGKQIVAPLFPLVWEAFQDYRLGGMFLSRLDREMAVRLARRESSYPVSDARRVWQDLTGEPADGRSRERDECIAKLRRLGILPEGST